MNKESIKKYFEEELTDSRLLVLIGYLLIEDELKEISTKKSIINFEEKLNEYKENNSVSLIEPIKWIEYLRKLKNSLSHTYLSQDEFNILLKEFLFIDLDTGKETKFEFEQDYTATNLSHREELRMLILNIICLIDLVKNPEEND